MESKADLAGRIRDRLLTALHVGRLRPGDRLPSIREVSKEIGADHRVVAGAYRRLQAEGLVEVRGRSGVYVARQENGGDEILAETAKWLAGVLTDAWRRQIPLSQLHDLLRRCTTGRRLRVACVESNLDQMTAYCSELGEMFGLESVPVYVAPDERADDAARLRERLRSVDAVVTTRFHAKRVQSAARPLGKQVVVVTANPEVMAALRREMDRGELVVIAADPEFGERVRAIFGDGAETGRIRILMADEREEVARLAPTGSVLLTRAARARLEGMRLPAAIPHSPSLSPETAREIAEVIIRLNAADGMADPGG